MRILVPLLSVLAGCAWVPWPTTQFIPTNAAPQPMRPKAPDDVSIVSTAPNRPFVEVGFIEGWQENSLEEEASVLAKMRAKAGALGCDVLLITGTSNYVSGFRGSTDTEVGYHGACLVFGEAPPRAAEAAPPAAVSTHAGVPSGLLFRNGEGNLYRVQPEAKDDALRAGWTQVQ
jgi:hypothetical protein